MESLSELEKRNIRRSEELEKKKMLEFGRPNYKLMILENEKKILENQKKFKTTENQHSEQEKKSEFEESEMYYPRNFHYERVDTSETQKQDTVDVNTEIQKQDTVDVKKRQERRAEMENYRRKIAFIERYQELEKVKASIRGYKYN